MEKKKKELLNEKNDWLKKKKIIKLGEKNILSFIFSSFYFSYEKKAH